MKKKYRIVKDSHGRFQVQVWRWWFPFWIQPELNSHTSMWLAKAFIYDLKEKDKNKVFYEE